VINKNSREEERTKNNDIIITNSIASYVIPFKQQQPAIQFKFYFIFLTYSSFAHINKGGNSLSFVETMKKMVLKANASRYKLQLLFITTLKE